MVEVVVIVVVVVPPALLVMFKVLELSKVHVRPTELLIIDGPGPVIRPPARWTMLVEELPKSMLRQSPNQQIPFHPTPGLNALFKGLLLTDAKRHMCHVPCAMCTMCHVHIVQTNDAGTNAICFTETVAVQD